MERKKNFIVDVAFYGIILAIVLLLGKYILPIMTPFVIAFCVAALIHKTTRKMRFRSEALRRVVAIILCSVLYAVLLLGAILLSAKVITLLVDLFKGLPSLVSNVLIPWMQQGADSLETAVTPVDNTLASWIDQMSSSAFKSITNTVSDYSGKAVMWATKGVAHIPSLIVDVVIMVVASFFMVMDFDRVCSFLLGLIPARQRGLLQTSLHYAKAMVLVYLKSYSLLFLVTFVELMIGFLILGVHNAPLLALMIAVLDALPVLGVGGILLPWSLVMFIMSNLKMGIGLLLLYIFIAGIRNTLEPRIVGKQIGLHPLATLAAMLLGLRLFGLLGMIGLPVALMVANAMRRTREAKPESAPEAAQ